MCRDRSLPVADPAVLTLSLTAVFVSLVSLQKVICTVWEHPYEGNIAENKDDSIVCVWVRE